ncbi:MAG TPA: VOC family protein [Candidatus Limnocylindria bacterium]|nr:VOC family protein [Candidatus Limnocylindria bacterium]
MNSVVHFEILADDPVRAMDFYRGVFGWRFEDYRDFVGSPYWGVITKDESGAGIDGGLMGRQGPAAPAGASPTGFVCTVEVADFDATAETIKALGGAEKTPKYALTGMAWQGYFTDTEGNLFGIHQPDRSAR